MFVIGLLQGSSQPVWCDKDPLTGDWEITRNVMGDEYDAYNMSYNEIFSRWSNPSTYYSSTRDIAVQLYSQNGNDITVKVYTTYNSCLALPPSKPQSLSLSGSTPGNPVYISWDANTESDMGLYEISRQVTYNENPGSWTVIGTTTNTYYIDNQYLFAYTDIFNLRYRIRAKDTQNLYSVYSNEVNHGGYPLGKRGAVADKDTNDVEKDYSLSLDNYPNPFNPSTVIKFSLPVTSNIKLTIYNMMGQEIKTYESSRLSKGTHQFTWNGTNKNNETVASGIYIYMLRAVGQDGQIFEKNAKMILLR